MANTYSAGIVTAYGAAKKAGYTGTYEEFCAEQASFAQNAQQVRQDKESVEQTVETFSETTVPAAVQSVTDEGTAQVERVTNVGTTAVGNVTDAGTTQVGNVNEAGTNQVNAVNTAGATQVQAVEDKGEEVIGSIPQDYSALVQDVDDLTRHFNDVLPLTYSKNRYNGVYISGGYINQTNGAVGDQATSSYTGYIDISDHGEANVVISGIANSNWSYTNLRYAFYDADEVYIPGSGGIAPTKSTDTTLNRDYGIIQTPANAVYMRFSNPTGWFTNVRDVQIEYGSLTEFTPYVSDTRTIVSSAIEQNTLISSITSNMFSKNRYDGEKTEGGLINQLTGAVDDAPTHEYSDYISIGNHGTFPVVFSSKANSNWGYANLRYAFYDNNKEFIANSGGVGPIKLTDTGIDRDYAFIVTPENAIYMRFSNPISWFAAVSDVQIEYNVPTEYVPYTQDLSASSISEKVEIPASMTYGVTPYQALKSSFADGETLIVENNSVMKNQCINFFGKISGTFGSVSVGHGRGSYGYYITVDGVNISYCSNGSVGSSVAHGLTIEEFLGIVVEVDVALNVKVTITTKGGFFTKTAQINSSWRGDVFAANTGTEFSDAVLTWNSNDYKCPIWAFGDSYFTLYSPTRWPYYVAREWGYNNVLLNAYPGEDSTGAYSDLVNALKHGTPKYLLWCLGMNDKDQDNAPNANWLSKVESIIDICNDKGIELILCTIPNVTSTTTKNTEKNAWIVNSGIRYVDLASAIADVDGWLSDDGVHPSEIGGRFIALKMLSSVPELMQGK